MLYPVLHRLEELELIESYGERGENGRQRRYYRLRPEGRKALAAERKQWDVITAVGDRLHAQRDVDRGHEQFASDRGSPRNCSPGPRVTKKHAQRNSRFQRP